MTVCLYLKPALGKISLAKLQPEHVTRMLSDLTARGDLSPTTVRHAGVVLRIALGRALRSGKVMRNVATLVDVPRARICSTSHSQPTRSERSSITSGAAGMRRCTFSP